MNYTLPLRGVQLLFAFLVLVLSAVGISKFGGYSSSLNFLLFCGIWAILCLIFLLLTPSMMPALHNVFIILAIEAVTMIFFFAGFIAVAADIGPFDCDATFVDSYVSACQSIKAAIAFGAFSWLLWAITLGLVIRQIMMERSGGFSGGINKGPSAEMTTPSAV